MSEFYKRLTILPDTEVDAHNCLQETVETVSWFAHRQSLQDEDLELLNDLAFLLEFELEPISVRETLRNAAAEVSQKLLDGQTASHLSLFLKRKESKH